MLQQMKPLIRTYAASVTDRSNEQMQACGAELYALRWAQASAQRLPCYEP
jgi:hypothetical protein